MGFKSDDRLLILGNGPSLKKEYFALFERVACLGMNAAYRYWERIGWYPNLYCCLDDQVVVTHSESIASMIEKQLCDYFFLHQNFMECFPELSKVYGVYFLPQLMKGEKNQNFCKEYGLDYMPQDVFLSTRPSKLTTGSYALRFASFLGYRKFGLLGIDCRYTEIISEATVLDGIKLEISSTPKNNPNYFFDDYQVKGDRYNIPNPEVHEGNLHLQAFEALRDDIKKYNFDISINICTTESELYDKSVFPYLPVVDYINNPKLSAVFIPFVRAELGRLIHGFARWGAQEFAPYRIPPVKPQVELHLAYNGRYDESIEDQLRCAYVGCGLSRFFSGIHFHYSKLDGLRDLYTRTFEGPVGPEGYMAGPNNQFFDIIQRFSFGMSHIVILESDAIPIRSNWLGVIEHIVIESERFWICGSHYRGVAKIKSFSHINGNAIYNVGDNEFRHFFNNEFLPYFYSRVKNVPSLCYDIVLHDYFSNVFAGNADCHEFSRWARVAHRFRYSEFIVDVSHERDRADNSLLSLNSARMIYKDAYIFHGAVENIELNTAAVKKTINKQRSLNFVDADMCVVMIDPDALDQFGHYLAYDDQLDKALNPYRVAFKVLASLQLETSMAGTRQYFAKCLSDHSWAIGIPKGKDQLVDSEALIRFQDEVEKFLCEWCSNHQHQSIRLYMYCAGVPHAQALSEIINRHREVTAVINLFYLPFQNIRSIEFAEKWVPVLKSLSKDKKLMLTVPTNNLADDLFDFFDLKMLVTPHPSPTIGDAVFSHLQCDSCFSSPSNGNIRVLFPGAPTIGKGSEYVVSAVNYLVVTRSDVHVTVRDLRRKNTSQEIAALYDTLDCRIDVIKGILSNEEFMHIFRLTDVVVLPYLRDMFKYRNSGLLVDAIYCGKPVIVVSGTWLSRLVDETNSGIVVNDPSPESISFALTVIKENYIEFRNNAIRAAKLYFAKNSWEELARMVCRPFYCCGIEDDPSIGLGNRSLLKALDSSNCSYASLNSHKLIINVRHSIAGRTFIGYVKVQSDISTTVNVSLGLDGVASYEGVKKRIVLESGQIHKVKIGCSFTEEHFAMKLSVEEVNSPCEKNAVVTAKDFGVCESIASIASRIGFERFNFRIANKYLRDKDYFTSLGIYFWLYRSSSLEIYENNAVIAARNIGLQWVKSMKDLVHLFE